MAKQEKIKEMGQSGLRMKVCPRNVVIAVIMEIGNLIFMSIEEFVGSYCDSIFLAFIRFLLEWKWDHILQGDFDS